MRLTTLVRTRLEQVRNGRSKRARIEARQLKKFRRLVRHAATHSPYYRDIVKARGIDVDRCVPQDFPVMTKTVLMANFDRIVTDRAITREGIAAFFKSSADPFELYQGRYYVIHTSGTSGEVGYCVFGPDDWARGIAGAVRVNPPSLRKRRLAYLGPTQGHYTGVSMVLSARRQWLRRFYDLTLFEINAPLGPTLDGLNESRPDVLLSFSSALTVLAQQQLEGRLRITPAQVQCSGEPVCRADRELIEGAFGCFLRDAYACSEHLVMGLKQTEEGGMQLFDDDLIFEIESDHTVITNLFNDTLPLIRYRMSDVLTPIEDDPAAAYRKVEVAGRSESTPRFTNERGEDDFISPMIIVDFLVANVRRFQLKLIDHHTCLLRVCLSAGLNPKEQALAVQQIHERFDELLAQKEMRNVRYRVEVVDDLPVDPKTGKFRLVVPPDPIEAAAAD